MANTRCPECMGEHTTTSNTCEVCGHKFAAKKDPQLITVLLTKDEVFIAAFKNAHLAYEYATATGWIHQGVQVKGFEVNE